MYLPFIFRYTTEKYTSVRMVERKLLNRFVVVKQYKIVNISSLLGFFKFSPQRLILAHVLGPTISQVIYISSSNTSYSFSFYRFRVKTAE